MDITFRFTEQDDGFWRCDLVYKDNITTFSYGKDKCECYDNAQTRLNLLLANLASAYNHSDTYVP